MTVQFKDFRGTFTSWTALFEKAAAFAGQIEPERLISISHSEDENTGVVVVWYWADKAAGGDIETT